MAASELIAACERRLGHHSDYERDEGLSQWHRRAELRLGERMGQRPELGNRVWDRAERLAALHEHARGLYP
jgi:N-carbamoyl-L-amino-acid hydrolase